MAKKVNLKQRMLIAALVIVMIIGAVPAMGSLSDGGEAVFAADRVDESAASEELEVAAKSESIDISTLDIADDGIKDSITITFSEAGTAVIRNRWTTPIIVNGGNQSNQSVGDSIQCDVLNGTKVTITESENSTFRIWSPGYGFDSLVARVKCALIEMPAISKFTMDTEGTIAGNDFFRDFNSIGSLTNLPKGSFNTSTITTVGDSFFLGFNQYGDLTSLPEDSFDISNITTTGEWFFGSFNMGGALTSLPKGSFDTSNITSIGYMFFDGFNGAVGALTSLPEGSFNTSKITTDGGGGFFLIFNAGGALTSLPEGSFDTSNITTAGGSFFEGFNWDGSLTSLPEGSFDTSNITTAGNYFFNRFNSGGALTSLPERSFDISKITTAGKGFFSHFNDNGDLSQGNKHVTITNNSNQEITEFSSEADLPATISNGGGKAYINTDPSYAPIKYTVTFNSLNGSPVASKQVKVGFSVGTLPAPTRTGYAFNGWYTATSGGTKITTDTIVTGNVTYYAQWTSSGGGGSGGSGGSGSGGSGADVAPTPSAITGGAITDGAITEPTPGAVTDPGKEAKPSVKPIVPKTPKLTVKTTKKKLSLKWNKAAQSQKVTKYQIHYKLKSAKTWKTKTVPAQKTSIVLKNLKSGKTYQVQIRSYSAENKKKHYSSWTKPKTVRVK